MLMKNTAMLSKNIVLFIILINARSVVPQIPFVGNLGNFGNFGNIFGGNNANAQCRTNNGGPGICVPSFQCPNVLEFFTRGTRQVICRYDIYGPIICCPQNNDNNNNNNNNNNNGGSGNVPPNQNPNNPQNPNNNNPQNPNNNNPQNPNNYQNPNTNNPQNQPSTERISQRKCREYKQCTSNIRKVIVGGENADAGEYPHMATIGWPLVSGNGFAWHCGASLISEYFVVTAAHCSSTRDTAVTSEEPTTVRLGDLNLKSNNDGVVVQDIPISSIIVHPQYRPPSKYNDIALIRMARPARFDKYVRPLCLWPSNTFPSELAIATGWGKLGYTDGSSDILQKVTLKIFDNNACKATYPPSRNLKNSVIEQQLCAGDLKGGKDTCQGDSGGPLQMRDSKVPCAYHLIGITSFGIGCGGKNTPAIYTRISSYIDWIESVVWS